MTFVRAGIGIVAGVAVLAIAGSTLVSRSYAQSAQSKVGYINQSFQDTDIRDAIKEVCEAANVSYTISPEVSGSITAGLSNQTFEGALTSLIRNSNVTYLLKGGVYDFMPRVTTHILTTAPRAQQPPQGFPPQAGPRGFGGGQGGGFQFGGRPVESMVTDGSFLFVAQGDMIFKIDKGSMKVVGQVSLPRPPGGGFGGGGGSSLGGGGGE